MGEHIGVDFLGPDNLAGSLLGALILMLIHPCLSIPSLYYIIRGVGTEVGDRPFRDPNCLLLRKAGAVRRLDRITLSCGPGVRYPGSGLEGTLRASNLCTQTPGKVDMWTLCSGCYRYQLGLSDYHHRRDTSEVPRCRVIVDFDAVPGHIY